MPPFNYTGHLHFHTLSELGMRGGVAITIELKPAAINQSGKKLPVQFAEFNGTSICNSLNLIWPQPMHLELPWKLNKITVIEEYEVSYLKNIAFDVPVMPSFLLCLLHFLMKSCNESLFF